MPPLTPVEAGADQVEDPAAFVEESATEPRKLPVLSFGQTTTVSPREFVATICAPSVAPEGAESAAEGEIHPGEANAGPALMRPANTSTPTTPRNALIVLSLEASAHGQTHGPPC